MREKEAWRMTQVSGLVKMSGVCLARKAGDAVYCGSADRDVARVTGSS